VPVCHRHQAECGVEASAFPTFSTFRTSSYNCAQTRCFDGDDESRGRREARGATESPAVCAGVLARKVDDDRDCDQSYVHLPARQRQPSADYGVPAALALSVEAGTGRVAGRQASGRMIQFPTELTVVRSSDSRVTAIPTTRTTCEVSRIPCRIRACGRAIRSSAEVKGTPVAPATL